MVKPGMYPEQQYGFHTMHSIKLAALKLIDCVILVLLISNTTILSLYVIMSQC